VGFLTLWISFRKTSDPRNVRQRQALSKAKKSIQLATQQLGQGKQKEGYGLMQQAIWTFVGDRLLLPAQDLTKDKVKETLLQQQIAEDKANELIRLLDTLEMAVYAPGAEAREQRLANQCLDILSYIDKQLSA
jgi:hypothetical protein